MTRSTLIATILSAGLALLVAGAVEAAEYYVDGRVSSSGDGSIGSPLKTIQEGINRLTPGDVLWVRGSSGGVRYTESLSLPASGTAAQPITVRVYPGEQVLLTGTSGARLSIGRDHWIFDGLTIDQANLASDAVKINGSHVVIRNAVIRNGQREGIAIERAAFVTIEDSRIHDFMWISSSGGRNDAHCIMIDTSQSASISNVVIRRNVIERCSGDGTQVFGVTGQPVSSYAKNLEFLDNTFIDGTTVSGQTENALDFKAVDTVLVRGNTMLGYKNNKTIVVQKGSRHVTIDDNVLADGLSGIEMRQEGGADFLQLNNRITRNIVRDMASFAIKLDGLLNAVVLNNTLVNIGAESFRFDSTLGSSVPSVEGGQIKNNLVYRAASAPSGVASLSQVDVSHNGWFQASSGSLARGTDTLGSDPLFASAAADDYRLAAGSPAVDRGTPVGLPFAGSAPDLGALELGLTPDVQPPNPPTGLRVQ